MMPKQGEGVPIFMKAVFLSIGMSDCFMLSFRKSMGGLAVLDGSTA